MNDIVATTGRTGQALDPFAFLGDYASRIAGLGGDAPGHDPAYAFHTPYVPVASGAATFEIRFDGLEATRGTLTLRVHMMPLDRSAHAALVNSERVALPRLMREGGTLSIGFEGYRGMTYAVLGSIHDDTDATAAGLVVTLDNPFDAAAEAARTSAPGTTVDVTGLRASTQLVSAGTPGIAAPVSQAYTIAQTTEPVFLAWQARLRVAGPADRALWEQVYVLQALSAYGLLQPGARALGLGVADGAVPAMLAAAGLDVVVTGEDADRGEAVLAGLRRPDLCADAVFADRVTFRAAPAAAPPPELANFDFMWSDASRSRESLAAALRFVDDTTRCVATGGLVIHLFDMGREAAVPAPGTGLVLTPGDVTRIALHLISRGREVAQLKTVTRELERPGARRGRGAAEMATVTSCGLIARMTTTG